jgi:DNA polymerase-3 subunit epsilon
VIHAADLVGAKDIAGLAEAASVRVSRVHVTVPEPEAAEQPLPLVGAVA